jgi:hypothetical protein
MTCRRTERVTRITHVADHLVDARAHALGELVVVERGRVRVSLDTLFVADGVELVGRDPWSDVRGEGVQDFTRHLMGKRSAPRGYDIDENREGDNSTGPDVTRQGVCKLENHADSLYRRPAYPRSPPCSES